MRPSLAIVVVALGFAGLGANDCDPQSTDDVSIYTFTAAPLGASALVQERDPTIPREARVQITAGVALAVRCWDNCDYTCVEPRLVSADPSTLAVRPLLRPGMTGEFALVAVKSGSTTLTLESDCATKTYPVEVIAP
ncbi:MAG: hypothetical protein IT385_20925 [Deltaproteobacteria bacterium]|nr:hypothetical protein [Deltaproteobacteria bacterium]